MIQPKDELIRDAKISGIKKQVSECINAAFSKGYETCFEQKKEIEDRAYQKGLEDGKQVGYDKGYEYGARCQDEVQYQKGLEDMRDAFLTWLYIPTSERTAVFGVILLEDTLKKYTAVEFFEKVKALKQKQKQEEAKVRFREKLESGYFSGKQKQDKNCDTCAYGAESSQICFYSCLDEETGERTAWTPKEEKQRQEEPQDNEIKIGDEVIIDDSYKGAVIRIDDDHDCPENYVYLIIDDLGDTFWRDEAYLSKTGRHFDGIEEMMKQMRGDGKPCTMCPAEGKVEE